MNIYSFGSAMHKFIAAAGLVFCLLQSADGTTAAAAPAEQRALETEIGYATYYAKHFQGDITASGLRFDHRKAVAAHRRFPFCTVVRVTNLENNRVVNVAIVDRGPYGENRREGTIIDLSRAAAEGLGMIEDGQIRVKLEVLRWGETIERGDSSGNPAGSCADR